MPNRLRQVRCNGTERNPLSGDDSAVKASAEAVGLCSVENVVRRSLWITPDCGSSRAANDALAGCVVPQANGRLNCRELWSFGKPTASAEGSPGAKELRTVVLSNARLGGGRKESHASDVKSSDRAGFAW